MAAFLVELLSRHVDPAIDWKPIDYGSKQKLLGRLPARMAGYALIPPRYRPKSVVLVDRDDDDCRSLKAELDGACIASGLVSRSVSPAQFDVVNRIVCEELEAWFFGDRSALDTGWPGMGRVTAKAAFRDPDAVRGGTHEALLREFQRAGYLKGLARLPKIDTARAMGALIDPERNTSRSFQHFWSGFRTLAAIA